MNQLTSILVCVDFSESSKTALAQAGRIARWNGAALHVVHVILPRVVEDLAAVRGVSREEMAASLTSAVDEDLRKLEAGVESVPPDTQHHVRIGAGFEEIRAVAREVNADLAVMGVVGADESTAGAGSLATKCVRKLPTRVLLVHSEHRSAFERVVACVDFSETSKQAIEQAVRVAKSDRAALYVLHVFKGPWHVLHYRAAMPESSPAAGAGPPEASSASRGGGGPGPGPGVASTVPGRGASSRGSGGATGRPVWLPSSKRRTVSPRWISSPPWSSTAPTSLWVPRKVPLRLPRSWRVHTTSERRSTAW